MKKSVIEKFCETFSKNFVVVFAQEDKKFLIQDAETFIQVRDILLKHGNNYIYTDIFIGSEEQCIKFCKDHNLKINDSVALN